jgi:hypothetical protein
MFSVGEEMYGLLGNRGMGILVGYWVVEGDEWDRGLSPRTECFLHISDYLTALHLESRSVSTAHLALGAYRTTWNS